MVTEKSPYRPYFQGNPSQVIFRSLLASEIQAGLEIVNPFREFYTRRDSPSGFTRSPRKQQRDARGNIMRGRTGYQM